MAYDPFKNALSQLSRAAEKQSFDRALLERLSHPEREVMVSIPVRMDDNATKFFEGYRVQHSSLRGPYKGGIRFHPATDREEVRALAFWMTMKTAVSDMPMGGGKGGVAVDPKTLSHGELERLSRAWVRALHPVLGPEQDVPAPDVNTTPEIMAWMADEYETLTGDKTGAAFTGKPLERGGSEGRSAATGMGGYYVFEALREGLGLPQTVSVAVQGMGNVGSHAAEIFATHGHAIVAMSDSKSGIYARGGLDSQAVERYKKEHGSLAGFPDAQELSNAELLELPVDVLIPAAFENQITGENTPRLRAKAVLELANGPTTIEADDILHERGIPVVPDVLANAGGVIVSTFEWQQNRAGEHWSEEDVLGKLKNILAGQSAHIAALAQEKRTDLRIAAFIAALVRLEEALHAQE